MWVCPSDHLMLDRRGPLRGAARRPWRPRPQGWLVTFGITPSRPETGFGWIAPAEPLPASPSVQRVQRFIEKPNRERGRERCWPPAPTSGTVACSCSRRGGCWPSWSAGRPISWPRRARRTCPIACRAPARCGRLRQDPLAADRQGGDGAVGACRRGAGRPALVRCRLVARDLGADGQGRAGQCRARATRSRWPRQDNLIRSEKRLVALAGVSGLAVIETADAVLVVDRQNSEAVRGVVDALAKHERRETVIHAREMRPWGQFTVLHERPAACRRLQGQGGRRRRPRPADLPVSSRPRRDLGDRRRRGPGRARRRDAAAARRADASPYRAAHGIGCSNPSAGRLKLIEIGYGEALGDDDTVRLTD